MNIKKTVLLTTTVFCVTLAMQEEKPKCPPIKELSCKQILSILATGKNPCGYSDKELKDKQSWCDDPMYSTGCSEALLEQKQREIDHYKRKSDHYHSLYSRCHWENDKGGW